MELVYESETDILLSENLLSYRLKHVEFKNGLK